jgi:hypothetical protein
MPSPGSGSISICNLSASARKLASLTMALKPARSAATRSAGTSGGIRSDRPISDVLTNNRMIWRCSSLSIDATTVGKFGRSG